MELSCFFERPQEEPGLLAVSQYLQTGCFCVLSDCFAGLSVGRVASSCSFVSTGPSSVKMANPGDCAESCEARPWKFYGILPERNEGPPKRLAEGVGQYSR